MAFLLICALLRVDWMHPGLRWTSRIIGVGGYQAYQTIGRASRIGRESEGLSVVYSRTRLKGTEPMGVQEEIKKFIANQPEPKRSDIQALHRLTLQASPECKLWFFDGKNGKNQTVSNPTIGYGFQTIKYASGKSREFFQIGVSGNKTGISVYILGLKDKKHLAKAYGKKLGKASVTGYCIRFKALKDIDIATLEAAIRDGFAA